MTLIDYPGALCKSLLYLFSLNTSLLSTMWQAAMLTFVFFLPVLTFLSIRKDKSSLAIRLLSSPSFFLLVGLLGVFILRLPNLVLLQQNVDEGEWLCCASSFAHHGGLWKKVCGHTSGPLVYAPINIMLLLGGLNYASLRLFGLLFCILPSLYFSWKTLLLLTDDFSARIAITPMFIFFASINNPSNLSFDLIAYNSEHVPLLLITASIYFLARVYIKPTSLTIGLLGLLLGFTPYAKMQAVPLAALLSFLALLSIQQQEGNHLRKKWSHTFLLVFMALLPSLAVAVYLTYTGAWHVFFTDYIVDNLLYLKNGLGQPIQGARKLWAYLFFILKINRPVDYYFTCFTGLLIVPIIYKSIKKSPFPNPAKDKLLGAAIFVNLLAYLIVILPGNLFAHYFILYTLPATISFGILFNYLSPSAERVRIGLIANGMVMSISLLYGLYIFLKIPVAGIWLAQNKDPYKMAKTTEIIKKYARPGELMSLWGWQSVSFVETQLISANKSCNQLYAITFPQQNNRYLSEFVEEVNTNKPIIFFDAISSKSFLLTKPSYRHENYPAVDSIIRASYSLVAEIDSQRIYVINTRLQNQKSMH